MHTQYRKKHLSRKCDDTCNIRDKGANMKTMGEKDDGGGRSSALMWETDHCAKRNTAQPSKMTMLHMGRKQPLGTLR